MNILFIHQNFPGQFNTLAPTLAKMGHNVCTLTTRNLEMDEWQGVKIYRYSINRNSTKNIHPWLSDFESKVIQGEACFHQANILKKSGYTPDVIIAHPGWGESLFLKDIWPNARLGVYSEFYYNNHLENWDIELEKKFPRKFSLNPEFRDTNLRFSNLYNHFQFDTVDLSISPTLWQANTYPEPFRSKISVIHEGINTKLLIPNENVYIKLKQGDKTLTITKEDEVITFVNRNLEPYRGYHIFMRSLPELLKRRPKVRVFIVGGDEVSYGYSAPNGNSWKEIFIEEVRDQISDSDWSRVHFLGKIPHPQFVRLLQLSMVHVYLTFPFVLSWSMLEAMSTGCAVVASKTEPVEEIIIDDVTGKLVNFFDIPELINIICGLLDNPEDRKRLGFNARRFIQDKYDLETICMPQKLEWFKRLAESK